MNLNFIITAGIIVVVILSLLPFIPIIMRAMKLMGSVQADTTAKARILQNGKSASAKVLAITQTGTLVNFQPMMQLQLEVDDAGHKYQTNLQTIIQQLYLSRVQVGMTVPVKIDPKDPNQVVLNFI